MARPGRLPPRLQGVRVVASSREIFGGEEWNDGWQAGAAVGSRWRLTMLSHCGRIHTTRSMRSITSTPARTCARTAACRPCENTVTVSEPTRSTRCEGSAAVGGWGACPLARPTRDVRSVRSRDRTNARRWVGVTVCMGFGIRIVLPPPRCRAEQPMVSRLLSPLRYLVRRTPATHMPHTHSLSGDGLAARSGLTLTQPHSPQRLRSRKVESLPCTLQQVSRRACS